MEQIFKVEIVPHTGIFALFCFTKPVDRTPVGHAIVDPVSDSESVAFVRYIHVVKECRGKGIGKLLIDKIKEEFSCVIANRFQDSEMESFYKRHGFVKISEDKMVWAKEGSSYWKEYNDAKAKVV